MGDDLAVDSRRVVAVYGSLCLDEPLKCNLVYILDNRLLYVQYMLMGRIRDVYKKRTAYGSKSGLGIEVQIGYRPDATPVCT